MTTIFIGIGSNAPDAPRRVAEALAYLQHLEDGFVVAHAPACKSVAVGFEGAPFVNMVVRCESDVELSDLVGRLKTLEIRLGKDLTQERLSDKCIDLDLLYFGEAVMHNDRFRLPAADVLAPYYLSGLATLDPDWVDPHTSKAMSQLAADCDMSGLKPVELPQVPTATTSLVQLDDLQVTLHLGVTKEEQAVPQLVSFTLRFEFAALPGAAQSDDVSETMNYSTVARALTSAFENATIHTLEYLAQQAIHTIRPLIQHTGKLTLGVRKWPSTPGLKGGAYFELSEELL